VDADDLVTRAATIDELLSADFESAAMGTGDPQCADRWLANWCQASAGGDWALFARRLARDGHSVADVRSRFATARRRPSAELPQWAADAGWIEAALRDDTTRPVPCRGAPFEHVLAAAVDAAERRLWDALDEPSARLFAEPARHDLRGLLSDRLSDLCAPALYERFRCSEVGYGDFVTRMKAGGIGSLFEQKPVLLRLVATVSRQWLTTTAEFVVRLHGDVDRVRRELHCRPPGALVRRVHGGLSDRHHGGRAVLRVEFDDGSQVMYKPKDLRLDAAWCALVNRLNHTAPVDLRAAATIGADGYGWAEYIEHTACDTDGCARYFRRAGAWLALLHCLAASDIHHENVIAAGEHPVPIDVETLLQPPTTFGVDSRPASRAYEEARGMIANSVAAVGLLPAYGKSAAGVQAAGGVAAPWPTGLRLTWTDVNTDTMRPAQVREGPRTPTNLPRIGADHHVGLGEHIDDFVAGFRDYSAFLKNTQGTRWCAEFAGLTVRTVVRPTQFYAMLLQRLTDDRSMVDGATWSAQADFVARLADWDTAVDDEWQSQRVERGALLELDVPMFTTTCDAGIRRARARIRGLDEQQMAWQVDVIRQTSPEASGLRIRGLAALAPNPDVVLPNSVFRAEADAIATQLAAYGIRRGPGAAWIGLGWFPDSDASQLSVLGHDLYNGTCGIAMFFAAHAKAAGHRDSADWALAAVARLRADVHSSRAARMCRVLGLGGGTGLGSIIYALAGISDLLGDDALLDDALCAARLCTDDLVAADRQLDVIGGSAGAILGLLRLYRATQERQVLDRALACGAHLLNQRRVGQSGRRSWPCRVANHEVLNGMSHGAAGFAYALAALAAATGRGEFADAARECVAFGQSNVDPHHGESRSQWCHGAVGIGLARLAMTSLGGSWPDLLNADIEAALAGAARGWPGAADTLCCGALGSVELARAAATVRPEPGLRALGSRRLSAILTAKAAAGEYRWSTPVASRFNVGLFRGLAGVGYSCLREIDHSLPNILVWQ
jgi:type 2 lantibiotic biosynthesis protein LanM